MLAQLKVLLTAVVLGAARLCKSELLPCAPSCFTSTSSALTSSFTILSLDVCFNGENGEVGWTGDETSGAVTDALSTLSKCLRDDLTGGISAGTSLTGGVACVDRQTVSCRLRCVLDREHAATSHQGQQIHLYQQQKQSAQGGASVYSDRIRRTVLRVKCREHSSVLLYSQ